MHVYAIFKVVMQYRYACKYMQFLQKLIIQVLFILFILEKVNGLGVTG